MEGSRREIFKKMFLNDSYIRWLSKFMNENGYIDNLLFVYENEMDEENKLMVSYLDELFRELHIYHMENGIGSLSDNLYCFRHGNSFYVVKNDGGCCSCKKCDKLSSINGEKNYYLTKDFEIIPAVIDYDDLKTRYNLEEQASAHGIVTTEVEDLIRVVIENSDKFYSDISYMLSPEERMFIISHLINKSCMSCTNDCCRVEYHEKIGYDSSGNPVGSDCVGWHNSRLIGKSKVLKINDIRKLL